MTRRTVCAILVLAILISVAVLIRIPGGAPGNYPRDATPPFFDASISLSRAKDKYVYTVSSIRQRQLEDGGEKLAQFMIEFSNLSSRDAILSVTPGPPLDNWKISIDQDPNVRIRATGYDHPLEFGEPASIAVSFSPAFVDDLLPQKVFLNSATNRTLIREFKRQVESGSCD